MTPVSPTPTRLTPWGRIPAHWEMKPWKSFATRSGTPVVVSPDTDLTQVTVRVRHRGVVPRPLVPHRPRRVRTPNQNLVSAGQFIISKIDARNGACGFIPPELDGAIVSNDFPVYEIRSPMNPRYLHHLADDPRFWRICETVSDGTTNRVRLDLNLFDFLEFPVPPPHEQQAIADVLDSLNATISRTNTLFSSTDSIADALREVLLAEIPPVTHDSPTVRSTTARPLNSSSYAALGDVADIAFSSVDKKSIAGEIPVLLCNYTDVFYNRKIHGGLPFQSASATPTERDRWALRKGDVLFTKDSETPDEIGVSAYVTEDLPNVLCGYHLGRARPRPTHVDGAFLAAAFTCRSSRRQFSRIANGITRFGLNLGSARRIRIPRPSLSDQRRIAHVLDTAGWATACARASVRALHRVRQAVCARLLLGGLRQSR